jgi:hypothetical protein
VNEIQIAARTGKHLYVFSLNEIGEVKNALTNAYEPMDASLWVQYVHTAIEVPGTGFYLADMPESPPGVFSIVAYERKTVTESPSDGPPICDPGIMQWDGDKEIPFHDLVAVDSGVSGDPYLLARLYGNVDPLDEQGRQTFYDVDNPAKPRVRLSPTSPRGGRVAEKLS